MSRALLFRVTESMCAVPVRHVVETLRPLPLRAVTGQPPFVAGVAMIRGVATPVVSGAVLLGAPRAIPAGRFVTLRVGERVVALAVDSVVGVRDLPEASLPKPPALLGASAAIAALGVLDAELILVLESARILPESAWVEG
jgi:purine-binding chemotaxis protein CheW